MLGFLSFCCGTVWGAMGQKVGVGYMVMALLPSRGKVCVSHYAVCYVQAQMRRKCNLAFAVVAQLCLRIPG